MFEGFLHGSSSHIERKKSRQEDGIVKCWKNGIVECWKIGVSSFAEASVDRMEYWSIERARSASFAQGLLKEAADAKA
jgi:hypothetical protein